MLSRVNSCPYPESVNPLSPNGFKFSIVRIPEVSYFVQEVSIPEISLPPITQFTPFGKTPTTGDTLEFADLRINFLIDSNLANYKALFNWIRGLGFPSNYGQYTEQVTTENKRLSENASAASDATLLILGNTNNVIQIIRFSDCYITNLSSLSFITTSSSVDYLVGNASFKYSTYDFSE